MSWFIRTSIFVGLATALISVYYVLPEHQEETTVTLEDVSSSVVDEPIDVNTKRISVRLLDLTNDNVTYLTSEVTEQSVATVISDLEKFNSKNKHPIYLIIDTPGGSVIDGGKLISAIQTSKNPVYAIDVGIAASMGFMILEHAHKRFAVPRAILMAHPASIGLMYQGELDKAVSRLSFLKRFTDKMDRYIAKRAGMTYEEFKLKSNKEFWIDSEDALSQHLLDEVVMVKLPSNSATHFQENKLKQKINME